MQQKLSFKTVRWIDLILRTFYIRKQLKFSFPFDYKVFLYKSALLDYAIICILMNNVYEKEKIYN